MAEPEKLKEFPDVTSKLSAPKKLSQFEKERQAAQAKEKRAEAENAAALKAFQDSFADDGDDDDYFPASSRGRGGRYGDAGPRSGPGSLPGPPPSLKRKRALDEMREMQEARRANDTVLGGDVREQSRSTAREDEEDVDDAPRPTIQLSSLPPASKEDDIRVLLNGLVDVHSVRFLPPADPRYATTKLSLSAIATLASDVSTSQIDTAVSTLKDKYLGSGFYLSISRHLSSAAMHPSVAPPSSVAAASSEPFGAEKPRDRYGNPRFHSMRNAPPPMEHQHHSHPRSNFAPPDSYDHGPSSRYPPRNPRGDQQQQPPEAVVPLQAPVSLAQIQAIHTLVDCLLLEPNPMRALQIEAYLMSEPRVKADERFAFLYDAKSTAGVYYRYLLWSSAEEGYEEELREMKRRARGPERVFEDVPLDWETKGAWVPFPDLKELAQVVTDVDYVSSDEEDDDEDEGGGGEGEVTDRKRFSFLTPLKRARLVHLLSRIPTSNAKLRKGDIARVTNFAINHAGAGAEEIADLLLLNVEMPFSYSLASKYENDDNDQDNEQDEDDVYEPDQDLSNLDSPAPLMQQQQKRDVDDPSSAKLIALYTISDILSASSTAGARNAWKYRALFEAGLRACNTFAHLGRVEKDFGWGRLKGEQWKRRIGTLLGLWEGWAVFPNEVLDGFRAGFFGAMAGSDEREEEKVDGQGDGEVKEGWMRKFKRVEQIRSPAAALAEETVGEDVDGQLMDDDVDVDGKPMDDDIDGKPMDEDVDGIPMDDIDGVPMAEDVDGALDGAADSKPKKEEGNVGISISAAKASKPPPGPRRRMRAEDMFADSDEE